MKFTNGDKIEAKGKRRCVKIIGDVTAEIVGGYRVVDTDGIVYHVRHSDFDIELYKGR